MRAVGRVAHQVTQRRDAAEATTLGDRALDALERRRPALYSERDERGQAIATPPVGDEVADGVLDRGGRWFTGTPRPAASAVDAHPTDRAHPPFRRNDHVDQWWTHLEQPVPVRSGLVAQARVVARGEHRDPRVVTVVQRTVEREQDATPRRLPPFGGDVRLD